MASASFAVVRASPTVRDQTEDIDERLDECSERITRATLVLHKIAKLRAARGFERPAPIRHTKNRPKRLEKIGGLCT